MREAMAALVRRIQDTICAALEGLDGTGFREDVWQRPGGGGGLSRILEAGRVFEKAGVNTSEVYGTLPEGAAASLAMPPDARSAASDSAADRAFYATGISLVLHPHNPMAPTVHANYRYFERGDGELWWFGGGADLTPSYLFEEDARHFHQVHQAACSAWDPDSYPRFKTACDRYFYLPHRGETRGIGGIFFDHLRHQPASQLYTFVSGCAAALLPAYLPLAERRAEMPFTEAHKRWQGLRRGRYVEFNLIYDRGTLFGLKTGGRIESILMSLPRHARWEYDVTLAPGSPEAELLAVLRAPRDWV